jgi:2-oxoglutarate ferredoxin oxidoreductase subunit alpha
MGELLSNKRDSFSIVLAGEAGQGIQTVEYILTRVLKLAGYNIFSSKEFMSRIRGGTNSTEIRVSSKRVLAFTKRIDMLVPLSKGAVHHLKERISSNTIILGGKENFQKEYKESRDNVIDIPFSQIASEIGGRVYANTVAIGLISALFKVEAEILKDFLKKHFFDKGERIIQNNIEAGNRGYEIGSDLLHFQKIEIEIEKSPKVKGEILLNGAEAVALGAVAGGCNFLPFYPMSPSTSVAVFCAQHSQEFDLAVEQAEDEISAINMAIGAWYAGARAMVTTSGGGFALMVEGLSLAGMLETPVVIHLGQRPGPATGLPSRTEQGDLEFVLRAGHGEFPRIIFAPGTIEDAFYLTQKSFNLADKYQVPVFILTDQYLLDSYYNIPSLDISGMKIEKYVVKTDRDYKRYKLTEDGISPRGIPGFGQGLVVVDSDEHDDEGHITEDLEIRTKMVDKRLKKFDSLKKEVIPPELVGSKSYKTLVIGWGSTYHVIKEAVSRLGRDDISFLHFKQVYPLHPYTLGYIKKSEQCVIVENNATSQFGNMIKFFTGMDIRRKILKCNGLPFSVEEVTGNLETIVASGV